MWGGEESAGSGYAHRESKLSGELLRRERRAAARAHRSRVMMMLHTSIHPLDMLLLLMTDGDQGFDTPQKHE